MDLVKI